MHIIYIHPCYLTSYKCVLKIWFKYSTRWKVFHFLTENVGLTMLLSHSVLELYLLLGLCSMDGLLHQPPAIYATQWVCMQLQFLTINAHTCQCVIVTLFFPFADYIDCLSCSLWGATDKNCPHHILGKNISTLRFF